MSSQSNERKVALVTGASRGIGAATAIAFARRGYDLAITSTKAAPLSEIARQAEPLGARVFTIAGDLADMQFVESLIPAAIGTLGRIDVLVNNAAWRELVTMRHISLDSWERTIRICLTAPAFLAQGVARDMEKRRRGVIINVSSMMSKLASGISPAYIASKGALDSLTYDLAALYGPAGIRVVAVNPGAVDTDLSNDYVAEAQSGFEKRIRDWSEEMIPLRRWASADEIGRFIAMIASDDASYISGTTLVIDGGWSHQFQPINLKREQHPEDFR